MNATARRTWRLLRAAVLGLLLFTAAIIVYTFAITGIAQVALPWQANGSRIVDAEGQVRGSALLAQPFVDAEGAPDTRYFQPRPSAVDHDGAASSGSNLGPENPELIAAVQERRAAFAELNGVDPAAVPADALTASGSGLDPHISPANADLQAARVAEARGLDVGRVRELVAAHTSGPQLGFVGEARVNVTELNWALDQLEG